FFNRLGDAAWTVEMSLSNFNNPARDPGAMVALHNVPFNLIQNGQSAGTQVEPNVSARTRSLNRTYVSLGGGREWYLLGGAAGTTRARRQGGASASTAGAAGAPRNCRSITSIPWGRRCRSFPRSVT